MPELDTLTLSRLQFGLNIGFHILFPSITIALAWFLVFFRLRFAITGDRAWLGLYQLWTKVFALTFAMGVVSGIVMSFQFGTNWPGFMNSVGNIAGPLLAGEVLSAFFLEATFLGIMLFGMGRVANWVHVSSSIIVALGTTISAFWILALNSWMQTPAGHVVSDGQLIAGDWWQVIFNPSFPYRLTHMLIASGLTASFLISGLSAWRLLKARSDDSARRSLRMALIVAALLTPVQIVVGDQHGANTLEHQPAKIAAIEALWETQRGAPLVLFAIPNAQERRNDFELSVPWGASLILTHSLDGEVKGIADFVTPAGEPLSPPVAPVFFAFRVMVGTAILMLVLSWTGVWNTRRGMTPRPWLLWTFVAFTFAGWVATLAGWLVTEIGRQPWLATGILRTADAVGSRSGAQLGASLTGYLITYGVMLTAYVVVVSYLARAGLTDPEPPMSPLVEPASKEAPDAR